MRIGELIRKSEKPFFSVEFFPPSDPVALDTFYATVDDLARLKPLFASVTYGAGGKKRDKTLEVTAEIGRRGLTAMAHLTCVGADEKGITDFVNGLRENGARNILALRGDYPEDGSWSPENARFRNASDLLRFLKNQFPDMDAGVAVYPYPHPESPTFSDDRKWTAEKMAAGADFAITQLFFDVREYVDLVDNLKQRGVDAPIIPGIISIQSFESLKRVLSLCGAHIPPKLYLRLEEASAKGGAEAVREEGAKIAVDMIRKLIELGAPGVHLYTLNKSQLCRQIIKESGLAN
ncbi:MAG: methylenetetrahydrofolate reductase [NAD(P)H] [Desulfovibrio sp.]|nr:methylenetetrahydrofolate reductase [NAD(P)H] [Desulfovibrio sp.]